MLEKMREKFSFFGPITFLYACFYAFCMFQNGSGVTFPFFIAASLLYLCFSLLKLEITLKRGSVFYMISMMLLAVSTFCTDDARIIAFNKTGIFLLMMSLLLKQFYETSKWKLGKYLGSIFVMCLACLSEIGRPFADATAYFRGDEGYEEGQSKNKYFWYVVLGVLLAVPLLVIVIALLAGADAVFRQITSDLLDGINFGNIVNVIFRITFLYFASYMLLAYLCKHSLSEEVKDHRHGEPILAITITTLLSLVYMLFSGIQIVYLFLGKMSLPEGYTYAEYAREGFFQLLAVSILNLILVLICMSYFKESKLLKSILTVMSLCTFIMIASSALRMLIYIRFYDLTFLRLLVLWGLALLFVLFVGVIISIYREQFPLFRYSMVVVTLLYLVLSFSHPDYIIAAVNVENIEADGAYIDYWYLSRLSADAAPVLIPFMERNGYDMNYFYDRTEDGEEDSLAYKVRVSSQRSAEGFGYAYLYHVRESLDNFGIRTYNVSRHMALLQIEKACSK